MHFGLFLLGSLLVVILVVAASALVIFYDRYRKCVTHPNTWCYNDWNCQDAAGNPTPMDTIGHPTTGILARCSPISAERATELNSEGHRNIYPNRITYPLCTHLDTDTTNCPAYSEGDIDWTTCVAPAGCVPTGTSGIDWTACLGAN